MSVGIWQGSRVNRRLVADRRLAREIAAEAYIYARREWACNNVGFEGGQYDNASLLERARKNVETAEQNAERFRVH